MCFGGRLSKVHIFLQILGGEILRVYMPAMLLVWCNTIHGVLFCKPLFGKFMVQ